jgi:hypothetical protein
MTNLKYIIFLCTEEMKKQLAIAVDMIENGNSYRRVSNLLHIPKSTIYSYVLKRREGKDKQGLVHNNSNKSINKPGAKTKIIYPPPIRVKVELKEESENGNDNLEYSDDSQ